MLSLYELSLNFAKDLYLIKVKCLERNDEIALNSLKDKYPELFQKKFLYKMLSDYIASTTQPMDSDTERLS